MWSVLIQSWLLFLLSNTCMMLYRIAKSKLAWHLFPRVTCSSVMSACAGDPQKWTQCGKRWLAKKEGIGHRRSFMRRYVRLELSALFISALVFQPSEPCQVSWVREAAYISLLSLVKGSVATVICYPGFYSSVISDIVMLKHLNLSLKLPGDSNWDYVLFVRVSILTVP